MTDNMTEKTLSFFRVFDLAFFAPGTVLFLTFWNLGLLPLEIKSNLATAEGAIAVISSVAAIYVIGLSVHALVWVVFLPLLRFRKNELLEPDWIPFPMKFRDYATQNEIILYFWYLRSTCWNLGVSIALSLLLWLVVRLGISLECLMVVCGIVSSGLLIYLGRDYDLNERRSFDLLRNNDGSSKQ